jgi:cytochrome c oxidase assembly factor CtaG
MFQTFNFYSVPQLNHAAPVYPLLFFISGYFMTLSQEVIEINYHHHQQQYHNQPFSK